MKVILISDVSQLGHLGEIKDVSQGYARNYLLPHKLALPATPENIQRWAGKKVQAAPNARQAERWQKHFAHIDGQCLQIRLNANEDGKLFGAIHQRDIVRAIDQQCKVRIPDEAVHLKQAIKSLGEYPIQVGLGSASAKLTIEILPQS